jgi:hypothetical protein
MYWLDGSSVLPFVPHCSYFVSSSRALAIAGSIVLIEDQAQIVKSCVKIGDFDHWCYAASELVDLVIEFAQRDEKYLQQDGLSSCEEGLRRILELNSQFVNFVQFSTFETAWIHLGAKSQTRPPAPTPPLPKCAPTHHSTPMDVQPRGATVMHTSHHTLLATTTTLHSHNTQPTGCVAPLTRVPWKEEVKREKGKRRERRERKGGRPQQEGKQGPPHSKPPTLPPPLITGREQDPLHSCWQ